MPIPPFVARLRAKVGNDLLLLPCVHAVILDAGGGVLLQRVRDDGKWYCISGVLEPGEEPASGIVREVKEEAGLDVEPVRITGVYASPVVTYANGNVAQFVGTVFLCRVTGGELAVADDESLEFRYFAAHALPELRADHQRFIEDAMSGSEAARFVVPPGGTLVGAIGKNRTPVPE